MIVANPLRAKPESLKVTELSMALQLLKLLCSGTLELPLEAIIHYSLGQDYFMQLHRTSLGVLAIGMVVYHCIALRVPPVSQPQWSEQEP